MQVMQEVYCVPDGLGTVDLSSMALSLKERTVVIRETRDLCGDDKILNIPCNPSSRLKIGIFLER